MLREYLSLSLSLSFSLSGAECLDVMLHCEDHSELLQVEEKKGTERNVSNVVF